MLKTIVAAVDGSAHSARAVEFAVDLAAKYEAHLIFVHALLLGEVPADLLWQAEQEGLSDTTVKDMLPADADLSVPGAVVYLGSIVPRPALEFIGARILDRACAIARDKGVKNVSNEVLIGSPAHSIVDMATRKQADLIVVGSRGLGAIKEVFLGSVSHKVCQLAQCPCAVAK